ncbi:hypothetical protein [Brevibacillus parabrevis]|uniref:hypothetical protein n=1 Tax=Brevibacillus parabrevis TaxID=54914 RepID=UPI0011394F35|nr:hypothetical protein [Brevibacillus parabrevis]MED1722929.1 hypothetical protein [Brevibacillus parabrevis]TGV24959.1 hypothetical protein EN829_044045 [Mesorhizobium sp. M00.F.Ca.ET.186.01.1.1]
MNLTFAVIGPRLLVEDICTVLAEFPHIEPIRLIYDSEKSVRELLQECMEVYDVYFFSGDVPFLLSQDLIPPHSCSIFIPFEGTDLYRAIFQIYRHYHFFPTISFDGIPAKHLQEFFDEIEAKGVHWFSKNMDGFQNSEELYEHHLTLWQEGKAQVVATSIHSVYERLKGEHVPVFFIKSTKQLIRDTINKALWLARDQKKQLAQITVLQFRIEPAEGEQLGDALDKYQKKVTEFSKRLFASMTSADPGQYTLYTTRGIVEKVTKDFSSFPVLKNSSGELGTMNLGIGMGETVERALYNANRAVEFAFRNPGNSAYLIDDQMKVLGPLGTRNTLDYSLIGEERGDFVSTSIRKLFSWLQLIQKNEVTTREISVGMNTGERNAARMVQKMKEKGIAEVIGTESMSQRGRPRPIYRIDLHKLSLEVKVRHDPKGV